jgi:LmbE family N-acetylglucosaminyl deacetylase
VAEKQIAGEMNMTPIRGFDQFRHVLFLGAHSDDIEIGAGGLVLSLCRARPDVKVTFVCLSGNADRHAEATSSMRLFTGRPDATPVCHGFPDTLFPSHARDIKQAFESLKALQPDLVLTHHHDDRHQDHRMVNELTWNAFRNHQIWEYEIPKWDGDLSRPNLYLPLADEVARTKVDHLMSAFGTQRSKHWFDPETFMGLMRLRGLECNSRYAEAFHVRKLTVSL